MNIPYVDIGAQYKENREEILAALDRFLASGNYILDGEVTRFEQQFAELCGVKHAIGVADGTASLSLCMRLLGIGPGDEVITAPNSFFSSASSIVHVGAKPIFADILKNQMIDPAQIEKKITAKTKAIMPVHLTGKIADMDAINAIAKKHNLFVIEDAAQAVGAVYKNRKAGALGDFGSFSLHPLKNLNAAGDAGIVTTNNDQYAEKLRRLRNHGMIDRDNIPEFGYNCRLDGMQAALLNVKLPKLSGVNERRKKNADIYFRRLEGIVELPYEEKGSSDVFHLFVIQCDRRDELKAELAKAGVATSIHYPVPIHLFECSQKLGYKAGDYPETEKQSRRILSLPVHQNLTAEQVNFVCDQIEKFYKKS